MKCLFSWVAGSVGFLLFLFPVCLSASSYKIGNGLFFEAEWLHWKAQEDNLGLGTFVDDFPDPTLKTVDAHLLEPLFTFNDGCRIAVGYEDPCNGWTCKMCYTRFSFKSSPMDITTIPFTPEHMQFFVIEASSFPIFTAHSQFLSLQAEWHGGLTCIDIDFAYLIEFSNNVEFSPHFGLRALWSDQHYLVEGELGEPSINDSTYSLTDMSQKVQAYGFEGGVHGRYSFGWGMSIVGHIGGSLLYAQYDLTLYDEGRLGQNGATVFLIDGDDRSITMLPTMDYSVRIQHELDFPASTITTSLSWEHHVFFDMNRLSRRLGNFSTEGVCMGVALNF